MKHAYTKKLIILLTAQFICIPLAHAPQRIKKYKKTIPHVITRWSDSSVEHHFQASFLKKEPIFDSFDKQLFNQYALPQGDINFRNDQKKSVNAAILSELANQTLEELQQGKELTHCRILKDREFDRDQLAGCIILEFNDYPFVLKIFSESPESFFNADRKGFRHWFMMKMTGGLNRYLAGFSRIKNLIYAQNNCVNNENLPLEIDVPRKWFWHPRTMKWLELKGSHFDGQEYTVQLPAVYGIIADKIESDASLAYVRKHYAHAIFKLCKESQFKLDPNLKNFRIERGTDKIVLIDTEHFSSVLGMKGDIDANNYFTLHVRMGMKAIYDCWIA